jgi:quercetin dioxygenase-like cupin family protein
MGGTAENNLRPNWDGGFFYPFACSIHTLCLERKDMSEQILAIADRLKALREIMDVSEEDMAKTAGVSVEEYRSYESGEKDFAFSFLFGCANRLGVDIIDLITGDSPRLRSFSHVKKGEGLNIDRRKEYKYQHLAFFFRNKKAEPFLVRVTPEDNAQLHLNSHDGQEFNYILSGSMKMEIDGVGLIANEGDAVYYDAQQQHGMLANGDKPCEFLAIIVK